MFLRELCPDYYNGRRHPYMSFLAPANYQDEEICFFSRLKVIPRFINAPLASNFLVPKIQQ
jgi:hypothetical protein